MGDVGVVSVAETRMCQSRRGEVSVAVAELASDLESLMLWWESVMLAVLLY